MAQKKCYCPYCPEQERKSYSGTGLGSHQRAAHPGKPFKKIFKKKGPQIKEQKGAKFELEPIGGNAASGFDAEFRLRIVLRIDVEK